MPRQLWIAGPAALLLAALAALFAALAYGGGAAAGVFADAGEVVRFGVPVAKLLVDLSASVTVGALVLACFAFDPTRDDTNRVLDIAAGTAGMWAVASAASGLFTYVLNFTTGFSLDETFGANLGVFLTETELGQSWLATTLIAAAVTVLCFAVRNTSLLAAVAVLSAVGLYPMASQGHAGGTENHDAAVTALYLHILFAAAWLGGLVVLALQRRSLGDRLIPVLTRYSTVALVCFIVVAVSGFVSAQLRIADFGNLLTPYGILVLVKIAALLALGLFGAAYRRVVIGRMSRPDARQTRLFWSLAGAELAFMGVAAGVAAALGRTATPVPQTPASELTDPTPAELLTGASLPPEPTPLALATSVQIDLLWLLVAGFGIAFYLIGVLRLRRRGDRWPLHRTILWIAGMLLLVYVTNGGIAVYERYLFSAHMVAHMVLGMMVPLLLVPGAPITLALRAIEKRSDGSRGAREWLLLVVHSRFFAFLANPLIAAGLFVGSLWAFYYTPLFSWATSDHLGHVWMVVHFLATGYLFTSVMIGIDPQPQRPTYPVRLLILLGAMAFHAFFGLALIMGEGLLLADWYGAMGWGGDAMADQRVAGGIAWSIGELPTLVLAVSVAVLWYRSDRRESVRYDRRADRDGDAELEAYNAMLTERSRRG